MSDFSKWSGNAEVDSRAGTGVPIIDAIQRALAAQQQQQQLDDYLRQYFRGVFPPGQQYAAMAQVMPQAAAINSGSPVYWNSVNRQAVGPPPPGVTDLGGAVLQGDGTIRSVTSPGIVLPITKPTGGDWRGQ